jgi:dolichol-phosphate mannosyltransferase
VVSGSRYLGGPETGPDGRPPAERREINRIITGRLNERLGLALTDAFCGFKAFRVEALRRLDLNEPGYAFPLQFWVQAAAHGLRIVETPVRLIYNDPNRSFGAHLDDADRRLRHYLEVFERELARFPDKFPAPAAVR